MALGIVTDIQVSPRCLMLRKLLKRMKPHESSDELVYELAEFLGKTDFMVPDASKLPRPRDEYLLAYARSIRNREMLRDTISLKGNEEELQRLRTMMVHLQMFQVIDPIDQALVDEINFGDRFRDVRDGREPSEKATVEEKMMFKTLMTTAMTLVHKYLRRSNEGSKMNILSS